MTLAVETEKKIEKGDIPAKDTSNRISPKKQKRPEWHLRSPIQDIFFRYGEYFS